MIGFSKKIATAVLSAAVVLTSFVPSQAIQMPAAPQVNQQEQASNVQEVQYRPYRRGWHGGYRGYRYNRPGYRHYNGYWYPLAAFGAGAIIGGAIAAPRYYEQPRYYEPAPRYRAYRASSAHVSWCANRYRSYRAYDNTFQPYNGPRQLCYSPYS